MLQEFANAIYVADGPAVPFYGFPYPTRMAVIRLGDGALWVWSPVALTAELTEAVDALGPVRHIVSPNKIHHLFMTEWHERWPEARLYASPGLSRKRPDLDFAATVGDTPEPAWAEQIDQVIFHGSFALDEVVFFHKASRTLLVCDLIQRFPEHLITGWRGVLMRLDGLVGERGSTPREWRASFLHRAPARAARDEVLRWQPEKLLIAHGTCVHFGAAAIVKDALRWI